MHEMSPHQSRPLMAVCTVSEWVALQNHPLHNHLASDTEGKLTRGVCTCALKLSALRLVLEIPALSLAQDSSNLLGSRTCCHLDSKVPYYASFISPFLLFQTRLALQSFDKGPKKLLFRFLICKKNKKLWRPLSVVMSQSAQVRLPGHWWQSKSVNESLSKKKSFSSKLKQSFFFYFLANLLQNQPFVEKCQGFGYLVKLHVYNMGPEIVFWSTRTDMVASFVAVPNNEIIPDLQHTAVETNYFYRMIYLALVKSMFVCVYV